MSILDDDAREFLKKPLLARITTIDPDGYPHTVPVWFILDGDDIVAMGMRTTRKVGHMLANPKGAAQIGGDASDGGGYMLKGDWSVEEDPDDYWMRTITYHYEDAEQAAKDVAAWTDLDIVAMRLRPKIVLKV